MARHVRVHTHIAANKKVRILFIGKHDHLGAPVQPQQRLSHLRVRPHKHKLLGVTNTEETTQHHKAKWRGVRCLQIQTLGLK